MKLSQYKNNMLAAFILALMFPKCALKGSIWGSRNPKSLLAAGQSRQNQNFAKMKKLGKLNLSIEKMLNQEELVNFRGGSGSGSTDPRCSDCHASALIGCENSCGPNSEYCSFITCLNNLIDACNSQCYCQGTC